MEESTRIRVKVVLDLTNIEKAGILDAESFVSIWYGELDKTMKEKMQNRMEAFFWAKVEYYLAPVDKGYITKVTLLDEINEES